jgi:hypothetical protein
MEGPFPLCRLLYSITAYVSRELQAVQLLHIGFIASFLCIIAPAVHRRDDNRVNTAICKSASQPP